MSSLKVFQPEGEALSQIAAILAKGVLAQWQRGRRPETLPVPVINESSVLPRPFRPERESRTARRRIPRTSRRSLEVSTNSRPTVHAG